MLKILLVFGELDGQTAFTAVLSVLVVAQKDAGAASFLWAFFSFPLQFADVIDLVEFQGGELDLGPNVLDLFWGGVDLLLPLSATSQNWDDNLDGGFVLDSEFFEGHGTVVHDSTVSHESTLFSGHALKLGDGGLRGDLQSLGGFALYENLHFNL